MGTLGKLVLLGVVKGAVLPVPTWELPPSRQEAGRGCSPQRSLCLPLPFLQGHGQCPGGQESPRGF